MINQPNNVKLIFAYVDDHIVSISFVCKGYNLPKGLSSLFSEKVMSATGSRLKY